MVPEVIFIYCSVPTVKSRCPFLLIFLYNNTDDVMPITYFTFKIK